MILKNTTTGVFYHVSWKGIRDWSTAICYDDLSKIKVKRTGNITFEDTHGNNYIRSTSKEIQEQITPKV